MELRFRDSNELTRIEKILIQNIYLLLSKINTIEAYIIEHVSNDADRVIEKATELRALKRCGLLESLKEQLWNEGSIHTLEKIYNQEKFQPESKFGESFLIDLRVLRKFDSFSKVPNNEKAQLAKKLGATITL